MNSGHNVWLGRGYQPCHQLYQPWGPYQQGPHSAATACYYAASTHSYARPCTVPTSASSSGSSAGKRTPVGSFKAPTHAVKRSHGTERSSRNVQRQKSDNEEPKSGSRHHRSRHWEPRLHRSKMAAERLKHSYSPISCDTTLSEGEIGPDENAAESRGRKIGKSVATSDREKTSSPSAKRKRLMSVVSTTPSDDASTPERQESSRKSKGSTESSCKGTSSVKEEKQTSHSRVTSNGHSAGSSRKHSTRFDLPTKSTTMQHENSPKNPEHGSEAKVKATTGSETCSAEDAFAYAYLDHSLNPSRSQDLERARSGDLAAGGNACSCNAQKQTLDKSTSTDELFGSRAGYCKEVPNRSPDSSSLVNCLDPGASFICGRNDATVRKWIMDSGAYSPSSPTRTLEIDQETVLLTSEPSVVGSCDMDISNTDSLAPSVGSEEENYSIMRHEKECRCGSVLAAVNFELDVYTACSVLELCEDAESKEEVLKLYAEARELCSKEGHLERIRQLVRVAVEGKRSIWKNATSVLRKLAAIRWSTYPSARVPGLSVAIDDPAMTCEKTSRGNV